MHQWNTTPNVVPDTWKINNQNNEATTTPAQPANRTQALTLRLFIQWASTFEKLPACQKVTGLNLFRLFLNKTHFLVMQFSKNSNGVNR